MALKTMPADGVQSIEWTLTQPAQVNRSDWTGAVQTLASGRGWWSANVKLKPLVGDEINEWRSFLVSLKGPVNTFQLPAVEEGQGSFSAKVKGASQTGTSLATDGWGSAGTKLAAGQYVTIGDQLLTLTADVVADALGNATITFEPAVRTSPADNAVITTDLPYALVRLAGTDVGYSVEPGRIYGSGFSAVEDV